MYIDITEILFVAAISLFATVLLIALIVSRYALRRLSVQEGNEQSQVAEEGKSFTSGLEADVQALAGKIERLERERDELRLELWKHKRRPSRVVGYLLLLSGVTALVSSTISTSSILAFIGLGLTFWGVLLLFVTPKTYVKLKLLDSTAISSLTTIDRVIDDLKCKGKGIYLPPRCLKELGGGTVFIPSKNEIVIPPTEELAEERVFLKNPQGICLIPSGLELVNLFEKELGKKFSKADLNYLQNNLPRLFVEDLEIAEDLEMNVEGNMVHLRISGSVYRDFCEGARKLQNICNSFGCPLCSSIACALARVTGKPVIIEKNGQSTDGETIEAHYRIIEE